MSDQSSIGTSKGSSLGLAITYVTVLFFIWAVITNMLDPLLAAMKTIFTLNSIEAQLTTFAFFIAYGVMSMPAASFLAKKGYVASVLTGLGGIVAGCLLAILATQVQIYMVFLAALFTMASGITLLQVAANPLIAAMGDPKGSAFRLNLSQAFNSLGAASAIFFGSSTLLKGEAFKPGVVLTDELKHQALSEVAHVYLIIAGVLAAFIFAIFLVRKVIDDNAPQVSQAVSPFKAFGAKWARLGALAIFVYVGAEVAIGSNLLLFLSQEHVMNLPKIDAGHLVTLYMIFAMTGRFLGSALLRVFKGTSLLALACVGAVVMCGFVISTQYMAVIDWHSTYTVPLLNVTVPMTTGALAGFAALLVGLFNSIMFPTIFTTTLERSSAPASATSGLLCVAIAGGAIIPQIFAQVEKTTGSYALAFVVPVACYLYILWFANAAKSAPTHAIEEGVASGH